jgi:hypothetical protein
VISQEALSVSNSEVPATGRSTEAGAEPLPTDVQGLIEFLIVVVLVLSAWCYMLVSNMPPS